MIEFDLTDVAVDDEVAENEAALTSPRDAMGDFLSTTIEVKRRLIGRRADVYMQYRGAVNHLDEAIENPGNHRESFARFLFDHKNEIDVLTSASDRDSREGRRADILKHCVFNKYEFPDGAEFQSDFLDNIVTRVFELSGHAVLSKHYAELRGELGDKAELLEGKKGFELFSIVVGLLRSVLMKSLGEVYYEDRWSRKEDPLMRAIAWLEEVLKSELTLMRLFFDAAEQDGSSKGFMDVYAKDVSDIDRMIMALVRPEEIYEKSNGLMNCYEDLEDVSEEMELVKLSKKVIELIKPELERLRLRNKLKLAIDMEGVGIEDVVKLMDSYGIKAGEIVSGKDIWKMHLSLPMMLFMFHTSISLGEVPYISGPFFAFAAWQEAEHFFKFSSKRRLKKLELEKVVSGDLVKVTVDELVEFLWICSLCILNMLELKIGMNVRLLWKLGER
ncbi:hypothetical protein JKY72_02900 [Candidatus Gracilibacteria bacterium]|nr:hypothetical protein [Candidatus Gracilibacteria bacterium]